MLFTLPVHYGSSPAMVSNLYRINMYCSSIVESVPAVHGSQYMQYMVIHQFVHNNAIAKTWHMHSAVARTGV